MNRFTLAYLSLGLLILTVELLGVFGRRNFPDTISDHWWHIQGRFPVASRIAFLGFVLWLSIHLLWHETERPPSLEPALELELEESP